VSYLNAVGVGDAAEYLRQLPDECIDSCVTDSPYGLGVHQPDPAEVMRAWLAGEDFAPAGGGFMENEWDRFVPGPTLWREVYRVLKPGAWLMSFFGTRTFDWGVMAIRFAGFEVYDQIDWLTGTGFPKSHNISKGIDALLTTGRSDSHAIKFANDEVRTGEGRRREHTTNRGISSKDRRGGRTIRDEPATEEGAAWKGWGTALKPAHEPIVLARKPFNGRYADHVLEHGTGALNIDAARVGPNPGWSYPKGKGGSPCHKGGFKNIACESKDGRWPSNVILSHIEYDWYTLVPDATEEQRATIYAYYRVDEAVRALRRADARDAGAARETTLLYSGVRWTSAPQEAQGAVGEDHLQALPAEFRGHTGMGEERAKEVLLAGVPCEGQPQPTRETPHESVSQEDGGRGDGQVPAGEFVAVEGRQIQGPQRLPARDDRSAPRTAATVRSEDGEGQVRVGAQGGCRDDAGQTAGAYGDRSPPERDQGRQPAEEPGSHGSERPQQGPPEGGTRTCKNSGGEQTATRPSARLEVIRELIPAGWRKWFVHCATDECQLVGSKRVRTGTAVKRNLPEDGADQRINLKARTQRGEDQTYADDDGKEEVQEYECAPGCPVAELDRQGGRSQSTVPTNPIAIRRSASPAIADSGKGRVGSLQPRTGFDDAGGASRFFLTIHPRHPNTTPTCGLTVEEKLAASCRFFYTPKAATKERWSYCRRCQLVFNHEGDSFEEHDEHKDEVISHPTQKPLALMEYLIRLVTQEGGVVLDPFCGTGSTPVAAKRLGFQFVTCDKDEDYAQIARARLARLDAREPSALTSGAYFCPGCKEKGEIKLISRKVVDRMKESGKKTTCMKCLRRFTAAELLGGDNA